MDQPLWLTALRALSLAAMAIGAWRGLKGARRKPPTDKRPPAD